MTIETIVIFVLGFIAKIVWDLTKDHYLRKLREFLVRRAKSYYAKTSVPLPSQDFHCYRIGNFEIPAMPLFGSPETPFTFDEVSVHFRPVVHEQQEDYPLELRAARPYLLDQIKTAFGVKNFAEDDILPRLDKIEQGPELPGDKRGHLDLYFSLTTFANQCATNRSLDYRVIPKSGFLSKIISNQTIREAYCIPPFNDLSKSILGNASGVDTVLISDNLDQTPKVQMIIRQRSANVLFFRHWYQVSATGYMSLAHRDSNNAPNPFVTAISESKQEVADSLVLSPEDFHLIGLSIDWQDMYPTFYGYVRTGKPIKELLGDFKRDSYEGTLSSIPFEPKSVFSHISKNKWHPQAALAAISALLVFHARDDIEQVARSVPAKDAKEFLLNRETVQST